jgi:hypothetical protein
MNAEGTCDITPGGSVAKISMKVGLSVSVAAFDTTLQNSFIGGLATALGVDASSVAITEIRDTTPVGRRLLQAPSIEITTVTTVPSDAADSIVGSIDQSTIVGALAGVGITATGVSTPTVATIRAGRPLTATEERLIENLGWCPCVTSS